MNQNEIRLIELKPDCLLTLLQELAKGNRESSKIVQDGKFSICWSLSNLRDVLTTLLEQLSPFAVTALFQIGQRQADQFEVGEIEGHFNARGEKKPMLKNSLG